MRNHSARYAAALVSVLAGTVLSGCSAMDRLENIGQPPKLTAIDNPAGRQIVAAIPAPQPIRHVDNSLWQPDAHSFFHDPRASHVGDVITVNVNIADAAKMSNTSTRGRSNSDNANLTNFFGLENALPSSVDPTSLVKMGSDMSNTGTGAINRSEAINLTLAALVAQVLPNGNLVIDGHQEVRVNNELRDMRVSGIVRREDITQDNTVDLAQIAEARISYGGRGQVTDVQQPRYGSQVFDILMPW
ncbi:MAG TPA: flagellar basal body L-ring protein FlgH [Rhizomicrobium sp.]|jgi:flagellar L-ring protein precursor FlgH|nr:flagellar basal body L-ring protein FlgH [Rhizomicrobium sp.]